MSLRRSCLKFATCSCGRRRSLVEKEMDRVGIFCRADSASMERHAPDCGHLPRSLVLPGADRGDRSCRCGVAPARMLPQRGSPPLRDEQNGTRRPPGRRRTLRRAHDEMPALSRSTPGLSRSVLPRSIDCVQLPLARESSQRPRATGIEAQSLPRRFAIQA